MSLFRDMDLYKWIVIGALVLVPASGGYGYLLQKRIDLTKDAIHEASRKGGLLEEIGKLQKQIEIANPERGGGNAIKDPSLYFETQILKGVKGISRDDFSPQQQGDKPGTSGKQRYIDKEIKIDFGKTGLSRKDYKLPRDALYAVLFNCESAAGDPGGSVWKLRRLHIVNASDEKTFSSKKTPPAPELEDNWQVKEMLFARREPQKDTGK